MWQIPTPALSSLRYASSSLGQLAAPFSPATIICKCGHLEWQWTMPRTSWFHHRKLLIRKMVVSLSTTAPCITLRYTELSNFFAKPLLGSLYLDGILCYDQWKHECTSVHSRLNMLLWTIPHCHIKYATAWLWYQFHYWHLLSWSDISFSLIHDF